MRENHKGMKEEVLRIFGDDAFSSALFYQYSGALRFELSVEGSHFDLFLQAMQRGETILDDVFGDAVDMHVCVSVFCRGAMTDGRRVLRALSACGLMLPRTREIWTTIYEHSDEDDEVWHQAYACFPIEKEDIRRVLWAAVSRDLGIQPTLEASLYLYSPALGILAHPYDDRGMDLIGPNAELLKAMYGRYYDWLPDHDRKAMDAVFEKW